MNQKRIILSLMAVTVAGLVACNSGGDTASTSSDSAQNSASTGDNAAAGTDPKGIGKYQNVELTNPLDETMVTAGKGVVEVKCASCHKMTDERLVGPGFAKVTERRTPEWIMNFVTNTDEMIEKDAEAQKMLEECLVRMPNQNLSEGDARSVLEFLRKNDATN